MHYKTTISEFKLKKENSNFPKQKISTSKNAAEFIKQFYGDDIEIYESMFMLMLNNANNTTGFVKISQGGTTGTVCDPIIVAKYAIDSLAKGVILAHNHPSGVLRASEADKAISLKVKQGLALFDVKLLDSIILTADGFFSMADEGLI